MQCDIKILTLFWLLVFRKTAGRTVVSISATTLPALVRSTHRVAGFYFPRSNASFFGLPNWQIYLLVERLVCWQYCDPRELAWHRVSFDKSWLGSTDLLALIAQRFSSSRWSRDKMTTCNLQPQPSLTRANHWVRINFSLLQWMSDTADKGNLFVTAYWGVLFGLLQLVWNLASARGVTSCPTFNYSCTCWMRAYTSPISIVV